MKQNKYTKTHTFIGLVVSGLSYFLFLMFSNPLSLPLSLLIIPNFLLGVFIYFLVRFLQELLGFKNSFVRGFAFGLLAVLVSMLASLGQLTLRDFLLALLLVIMFIFYFNRSKPKKP
jgi:hypothetical protein